MRSKNEHYIQTTRENLMRSDFSHVQYHFYVSIKDFNADQSRYRFTKKKKSKEKKHTHALTM